MEPVKEFFNSVSAPEKKARRRTRKDEGHVSGRTIAVKGRDIGRGKERRMNLPCLHVLRPRFLLLGEFLETSRVVENDDSGVGPRSMENLANFLVVQLPAHGKWALPA